MNVRSIAAGLACVLSLACSRGETGGTTGPDAAADATPAVGCRVDSDCVDADAGLIYVRCLYAMSEQCSAKPTCVPYETGGGACAGPPYKPYCGCDGGTVQVDLCHDPLGYARAPVSGPCPLDAGAD